MATGRDHPALSVYMIESMYVDQEAQPPRTLPQIRQQAYLQAYRGTLGEVGSVPRSRCPCTTVHVTSFCMYRGTSHTRNRTPLGPYRRHMPMVLGGPPGGGAFAYGRGTPVGPAQSSFRHRCLACMTLIQGYLAHRKRPPP